MHRIFCDFSPSFAFSPPEQPEKSKFRKKEKNTGRYHHFTLVYHKWWYIMIWYMIWYDIWYMIPEIWRVKGTFLVILDHFLLLYPPNNPENQHFGKMKKKPGDIIILCFCTINNNHMMYVYWDMECNRQNFLSFLTIFCTFTPPLTTWKITFWKMKKTPGDNITLHKCTKNHDHMLYCSWDMTSDGCNFHFSFWAIFCPFFIPLTAPKIKIYEKIKKNNWRYHNFTWAPKTCTVPELWCTMDGWTVRRTDQWKKWHTEVGALFKDNF